MSHGCSIDIPDVKGQTPLHVAVKNLHLKCAELLLERGANPNGHSHNRTTPLCIAAMQGNLDMVQVCFIEKLFRTLHDDNLFSASLVHASFNDLDPILKVTGK